MSRGMRLAETHMPLGAPLLLLGLWALLGPVQASPDRPSWRYASVEVVIPRKHTHHGRGLQVPSWLSYSLRFGGQRHIIHLRKMTKFQPTNVLVVTQNDQGALQTQYPYIPVDCKYMGYVEEVPYSTANIDTCYGGLEGIIKLDDLTYEIKPLKDSLTFEHTVSQIMVDVNTTEPPFRPEEDRPSLPDGANDTTDPRIPSKVYLYHPIILKALIISPNEIYRRYGRNRTATIRFMMRLAGAIRGIAQNIGLTYIVIALCIFDTQDPMEITDYRMPQGPFFQFYKTTFFPTIRPNSALVILLQGPYELDVAPPYYGTCKDRHVIYLGLKRRHYFLGAVIGAQQVTRNFGLFYDHAYCQCQRRATCVMYLHPVLTDAFSNCSYMHLAHIVTGVTLWCLYFKSFTYYNHTDTEYLCGNRVVEPGEHCDCGSFKQCYTNPCCQTNCNLTPGSICDGQDCCTNCTYSPTGTLCRAIKNICDLPEHCLGNTLTCPEDLYMQDGTPCTEEGYCYLGNCSDRSMHCREIFGRNAVKGDIICYQINAKGNRFGHCSRAHSSLFHRPCLPENLLCGRLQCGNVSHLPRLQEHVSFHQSKFENSWCFGVDEHRETLTVDVGHVRSGSQCAPGKYCINFLCNGSLPDLNYDCAPEKCSFRGVCNNHRQCHCHVGWDPPLCKKRGAGGSASSGPPPRYIRVVTQKEDIVHFLRVVFGRIYAFIAALLFGVAANVRTIKTVTVQPANAPQPT
ncbi:disintegrin and metalloproteinase domain-containing protein 21-like [Octodon degus]|uniref:Disintegrin and metalloproteinase domain-containing protein 21-like n=1 Tax=Octodon degus TaxID=10160 RepID=A0A6P3FWZ6_OCTDE|nr:disintegrin and metalloproteinase domain-containing protein 21-like [Octodon degus]